MKKNLLKTLMSGAAILGAIAMSGCSSNAYNLPIVAGETGMNDVLGVATYGVNYFNLGTKAGTMAGNILITGTNPSEIPVATDTNPSLVINETVAKEINFEIPQAVKDKATTSETVEIAKKESAIASTAAEADYKVGIIQLAQHSALDKAYEGFVAELSNRMDQNHKKVYFDYQNAAGESSNNSTICASFVSNKYDLIYSIATSSSQAAVEATKENNIPVIFNAVTDPVGADLVDSLDEPGHNVTGVSDINPVAKQIDLIGELLEGKDDVKIGLLYTSAEVNSVYQIELAKAECDAKGYKYYEKGIGDINDTANAFISIKQNDCNAVYIPTDNVLASGAAQVHTINTGK